MTLIEEFRAEVDEFLLRTGMAPTALGQRALGTPHFVRRLRAGTPPNVATMQRVLDFIRAYEPAS
jgi:predicted transcriptional regulator